MSEKKITAKDMEKYLENRYWDGRQWVFLTQVRSSTGGAGRIADAMAFNMYNSTGYEVIGFEIKVSRSDWLSELKDMSKSNEIMEYCDKWFLVVPDADMVKDGELPKGWGLLVLKDEKLVMKVRPTLQATIPMPDHFIASIFRRYSDEVERIKNKHIHRDSIEKELKAAEDRGYERGRGYNGKQTETVLKELREQVSVFEEVTGVEFNTWKGKDHFKKLGAYVKFAMDLDSYTLDSCIRNIESTITSLETAKTKLKTLKK